MRKQVQNEEYVLKADKVFLKWFKKNNNSHFYLTIDEIQNMINKISSYYENNISNIEINNLLENKTNVLGDYFLEVRLNKDNSKYTLLKEEETLKCNYRIEKPIDSLKTKQQDHWIDYIWLYIKISNTPLYIGAYRDGIIREDDVKKYFNNLVGNKDSQLTLQELYFKLSTTNNTKETDFKELKEALVIHQNDLILRDIISHATASNILYSKQNDFISNLKRAKLFIKNIENYNLDQIQKENNSQFTLK